MLKGLYKFLFSYKGRISLGLWWTYYAFMGILFILIDPLIRSFPDNISVVFDFIALIFVYAMIPLFVKRVHDLDMSVFWPYSYFKTRSCLSCLISVILSYLMPLWIASLFLLVWFMPGKKETNRYGEPLTLKTVFSNTR